jgi:Bacterial regulatory proteins, gntR family/Helix-turn-helix domain
MIPPLKRDTAAALVRQKIADGTLKPGDRAPSGRALAAETGYSVPTCQAAFRLLLADGTLVRGPGRAGRPAVALPRGPLAGRGPDLLGAELSETLAGLRHEARLTQPELAAALGVSMTAVGHAETGRLWQGRPFWERADVLLGGRGALVRLYGAYREAKRRAPSAPEDAAAGGCSCGGCAVLVTVEFCDGHITVMRPVSGKEG